MGYIGFFFSPYHVTVLFVFIWIVPAVMADDKFTISRKFCAFN